MFFHDSHMVDKKKKKMGTVCPGDGPGDPCSEPVESQRRPNLFLFYIELNEFKQ